MCPFRYVEDTSAGCVSLILFRTLNGTPRADVVGARAGAWLWTSMPEQMSCVPLDEAFPAAIRMANQYDVELVVTGDASLWKPEWGQLSMHVPANRVDQMLGLPADILGTTDENFSYRP